MAYYAFNASENILHQSNAKQHSLFMFDDVTIKMSFENTLACRHNFIDSFHLTQMYGRVPKHLIRENANLLVLLKQSDLKLRYVCHIGSVMTFEEFKQLCSVC